MSLHSLFLLLFLSAFASFGIVHYLIKVLVTHNILDVPNERSSHVTSKPRGGGLSIVLIVSAGLIVAALRLPGSPAVNSLWPLIATSSFIALISAYDDYRSLPSSVRLFSHLLAGLICTAFYGGFSYPEANSLISILLWVVTVMWIVGLTNAYNFMDGIDGIAGLQGVIAGAGWMMIGAYWGAAELAVAGALIAGSNLGFLGHNWPPAKIFMGDVGSAFMGFVLAVLPLLISGPATSARMIASVAAALFVWPFVVDTIVTFVARLSRGENVLEAHRSHFYQRLVRMGWSHARVSTLYGALSLGGMLMAIYLAWA